MHFRVNINQSACGFKNTFCAILGECHSDHGSDTLQPHNYLSRSIVGMEYIQNVMDQLIVFVKDLAGDSNRIPVQIILDEHLPLPQSVLTRDYVVSMPTIIMLDLASRTSNVVDYHFIMQRVWALLLHEESDVQIMQKVWHERPLFYSFKCFFRHLASFITFCYMDPVNVLLIAKNSSAFVFYRIWRKSTIERKWNNTNLENIWIVVPKCESGQVTPPIYFSTMIY